MNKNLSLSKDIDLKNVNSSIYEFKNKSNKPTFSLELTLKANEWLRKHHKAYKIK